MWGSVQRRQSAPRYLLVIVVVIVGGGENRQVNESGLISTIGIPASALGTAQNSRDRNYGVPIPSRRWHAVQFVDLAKVADCLHVTTVLSEHELPLGRNHPHQPLPV